MTTDTTEKSLEALIVRAMTGRTDVLAPAHVAKQNARIEHDKALARVMTAILKDDTELFKHFMDNDAFKRWLTDAVVGFTYQRPPTIAAT